MKRAATWGLSGRRGTIPEWAGIAVIIGVAVIGLGTVVIQYILMSHDSEAWRRKMRRKRREAEIDRQYRQLQREVQRGIRNELRYELRHEIRREFEKLERRLGGRIDAASRRRLETSRAGRGLPEYGGRLSQRAIMTDSEWVARLRHDAARRARRCSRGTRPRLARGVVRHPRARRPRASRLPRVWTRFEFEWDATPGDHVLRTRATDETGLRQPAGAIFNAKGYLLNLVLPHPVAVE